MEIALSPANGEILRFGEHLIYGKPLGTVKQMLARY